MSEEHHHKRTPIFKIGILLILLNYAVWGLLLLFPVVAIKWPGLPWVRIAAIAYGISWVFFGAGLLLAGPSAARHVRHVAIRWIKKHFGAKSESDGAA